MTLMIISAGMLFGFYAWNGIISWGVRATLVLGLLMIAFMMMQGWYWDIFPRGRGFWTANRVSSLCYLIAATFVPAVIRLGFVPRRQ